ncbi:hypothetical protein PID90_002372 [Enterococcus faecalis]|nr:hypothetical protein [Enterococcus faecalis]
MTNKQKQRLIIMIGLILTGVLFGNKQDITNFLTPTTQEVALKVPKPLEKGSLEHLYRK